MKIYKISDRHNAPEQVLSVMEEIDFGYITKDGEVRKEIVEKEFYRDWYLQSPEELLESKIGVCWDHVELERFFLGEKNVVTVYIELENGQSHTLLTFKRNEKFYWFENSYKSHKGIHGPFETLNEIVKKVVGYMQEEEDGDSPVKVVSKYGKPKFGISCQEFMDFCKGGQNE